MHKLANFSEKHGKIQFELLLHLLRYNRDNNNFGLNYYTNISDAAVPHLLRQASIKTKNHLMDFSESSWQDCPQTGRSTGAYIIFYQGGEIDNFTNVPGLVTQLSA